MHGGSNLKFVLLGPQTDSDPHHWGPNFKIVVQSSSYAHSKGLDEIDSTRTKMVRFRCFCKKKTITRMTETAISFFVRFVKILVAEHCEL